MSKRKHEKSALELRREYVAENLPGETLAEMSSDSDSDSDVSIIDELLHHDFSEMNIRGGQQTTSPRDTKVGDDSMDGRDDDVCDKYDGNQADVDEASDGFTYRPSKKYFQELVGVKRRQKLRAERNHGNSPELTEADVDQATDIFKSLTRTFIDRMEKSKKAKRRGGRGKLSLDKYLSNLSRKDIEKETQKFKENRVYETWESSLADKQRAGEAGRCYGDIAIERMKTAYAYLDTIDGRRRSKQQKLMHAGIMACSLEQLYGADLNTHLVRLLKEFGWSELRAEAVILAPRRFGKTRALATTAGVELNCLRDHDVLIYSNNKRASIMMLYEAFKVLKILAENPDFGGTILSLNKSESITFKTKEGFTNTLFAYPANPDTLRGTGSKATTGTVIMEEFFYVPAPVFLQIVTPTLTRVGVKLICCSTVNSSDSFASAIVSAKFPDGRSLMLVMNFELVCPACKEAGKEQSCKCMMGDVPHWQSIAQHEKIEILMANDMETFTTELKGVAIDQRVTPAFCQIACKYLRTQAAVLPVDELYTDKVYCAVDPACGGKYSRFAIVSAIFVHGKMIVVGADSCSSDRPENQAQRLVEHIRAVRRIPGLETSSIIFCPESNLAHEGKRLTQDLIDHQVSNCFVVREDVRGNEGFRMTEKLKEELYFSTNRIITNRKAMFHRLMVSVSHDEKLNAEAMRHTIIDQLMAYQRMLVYNDSDPYSQPKVRYTGKIGSACDDHCIAFQVCYKAMEIWHSKPEFYSRMKPIWP